MKLLALLILSAVSAIAFSSCSTGEDGKRKLPPITIGYQTTAGGHTIAAGYSSAGGIAVNVSDK